MNEIGPYFQFCMLFLFVAGILFLLAAEVFKRWLDDDGGDDE